MPLLVVMFVLQDLVRLPLQDALQIWRYPASVTYRCPVDALLVMGAAQYDGDPSPAFRRRLDRAAELYFEGCSEQVVVTGGGQTGDRFSEGEAGVRYLLQEGVPAEVLVAETESHTSFENIRNSLPLLEGDEIIIATDDLHAFRSRWLARHFGLDAEVAVVPTREDRLSYWATEVLSLLAYQSGHLR